MVCVLDTLICQGQSRDGSMSKMADEYEMYPDGDVKTWFLLQLVLSNIKTEKLYELHNAKI